MEEKDLKELELKEIEPLLPKDKEDKGDCFIFLGKTGAGKTTIINLLCNSKNKIGDSTKCETKVIIKEKGKYFKTEKVYYCLDTPGFDDPEKANKEIDCLIKVYLKNNRDIKIKGIFFVINFQDKKLASSFWDSFNTILNIFPMKTFWKHIVLCFTHTFTEIDFLLEDDKKKIESEVKEEIKKKWMIFMKVKK